MNTNIITQAESKKLMYQGMRQGISWTVYLLNKKFVKEVKLSGETRQLYLVDEETKVSNGEVSQQTILIQCSTSQPFVAFKDSYEQQMAIIDFINPGEEPGGFNSGSYSTYWIVCHDLWQPWEYDLNYEATQLSYSTELKSEQIEIPYGLLQYLK